jgi:hypothetical protein
LFVGKRPLWVVITAVRTRRLRMMKVRAREGKVRARIARTTRDEGLGARGMGRVLTDE